MVAGWWRVAADGAEALTSARPPSGCWALGVGNDEAMFRLGRKLNGRAYAAWLWAADAVRGRFGAYYWERRRRRVRDRARRGRSVDSRSESCDGQGEGAARDEFSPGGQYWRVEREAPTARPTRRD
jgi:hypothetical protein